MIKIIRFKKGYKSTLGKLYINKEFFCYTLEKEWLDNEKYISCIPEGKYSCKPYSSKKYPYVTQVTDVENRDKILIHKGNYHWDVKGCILIGNSFKEKITVKKGSTAVVYSSKKTLKEFFAKASRDFELEIIDNVNFKTKKKIVLPLGITRIIISVKLSILTMLNKFSK